MKNFTIFTALIVVMIIFTACGSGNNANYEPQTEYETTTEIARDDETESIVAEQPLSEEEYTHDGTEELEELEEVEESEELEELEELPPSTGRIFLYGEVHGCGVTMSRQLEIWGYYYTNHGMRHLFIESSYFAAQFLNLWMQADDDTILYALFEDRRGALAHNPYKLAFYRTIKSDFPETIFHGTDVGHQSFSTGQRFLRYLIDNDMQDSESYRLAHESIEQFYRYQREGCRTIRVYYKPQNFIREFDRLANQDVMAIHGMAHVFLGEYHDYSIPTMAVILLERYGDALQTFDMTHYALMRDPYHVDIIAINDIDFEASYFGNDGARFGNVIGREFWRLENAYEHFRDSPSTGNILPFEDFPIHVEIGQVFIVDIHFNDGTVVRKFFRASGYYWDDLPSTQEFTP